MRARAAGLPRHGLRVHALGRHAGVPAARCASTTRARGSSVALNEIIATTGGSEAILFALHRLRRPGRRGARGRALLHELQRVRDHDGRPPRAAHAPRGEDGFHLPPREAWEHALTPPHAARPALQPEQPDRHRLHRATSSQMVARFCRDHGLFLVCDEVYREFVYDGRTAPSALSLDGLRGHRGRGRQPLQALQRLRHPAGLPRHAQPRGLRRRLRMAQGRLSPPGLAQIVAARRSTSSGPSTRGRGRGVPGAGATCSSRGSAPIPGVFLRKPEGAFYFVARLPVRRRARTSRAGC